MKSPEHPKGGRRERKQRPTAAQLRARSALTSASHGWDDLTDADRTAWHVAGKQDVKKFGNPPPGSRVFIRAQQQVDGQQDHPVQTDALVPDQRKRRRATGAG